MFTTPFSLADLDGSNGFVLPGINEGDKSGRSVSSAGDINGDGIDDIIIGAPGAGETESYNGYSFSNQQGESYVVFGSNEGFDAKLDLTNLDGSNGFVLRGVDIATTSGYSVSGAGDVNGDGIDDIIIGAPIAYFDSDISGEGDSYVVFGNSEGFAAELELASLDGSNGFVLRGIEVNDDSGYSVSSAGDFNGDGIDDLLVGTSISFGRSFLAETEGESYVVFGSSEELAAEFDLASLDGSNGLLLRGIDLSDYSGRSVSGAGDVNGDGIDDIIIGASRAGESVESSYGNSYDNNSGESYVIFGSSEGFDAELNLASLDGNNGFLLRGVDENDLSGFSVSDAGDVNGDGIDDIIIGALSAVESYVVFGNSEGFDAEIDLANLDGSNGLVIRGIDERDSFGSSVSGAGDVNGDGIDDIIIGAPSVEESYVVFGNSEGFDAEIDLANFDSNNGFVLIGVDRGEETGASVSSAGDVNGDGIDDIIIGAPKAEEGEPEFRYDYYYSTSRGESYVVFGMAGNVIDVREDDTLEGNEELNFLFGDRGLESLDGSNGFVIRNPNAESISYSVRSVSGAGDINGDGLDDLIVGAPFAGELQFSNYSNYTYSDYSGESYVIFGSTEGFNAQLNPANLDGNNGFVIRGNESDRSGNSVSSAGDVNGDGLDDLIIGAFRAYENKYDQGASYVVFGNSEGFNAEIDLASLDGSNGFELLGLDEQDFFGSSVSSAGDVNGDGIDDIIIGAPYAEAGKSYQGESYVVFGSSNGFNTEIDLASLDGSNGFLLRGLNERDRLGDSVSDAGDVNGDGIDDIIIGAPGATNFTGESYVIFGSNEGFEAEIDLTSLDGSNGFVLRSPNERDRLGDFVNDAGDVNGDGIDDIIIGASGATYIVFGSNHGFDAELDLASLDGSSGFVVRGNDYTFGSSVSGVGDVNGDGIDDLIVGAPYAGEPVFRNGRYLFNDTQGESYVVFGSNEGFEAEIDLTSLDGSSGFALRGSDRDDRFGDSVGGVGDLNGDGIDDLIVSAPYAEVEGEEGLISQGESYVIFGIASNTSESITGTEDADVLTGTAEDNSISGLGGDDSIRGFAGADTLIGGDGADTIRGNLDDDAIEGNAGFDLLLGDRGDDILEGSNGNDTLRGGADDDSLFGNSGKDNLFGNNGNDVLVGGNGNDILQGDAGSDHLDGGIGNDTLFGGNGRDSFVLKAGEGSDLISDYFDGTDKFVLGSGLEFNDLNIVQNIDSTQIKLTDTDEVLATLNSVTANFLQEDDFIAES